MSLKRRVDAATFLAIRFRAKLWPPEPKNCAGRNIPDAAIEAGIRSALGIAAPERIASYDLGDGGHV